MRTGSALSRVPSDCVLFRLRKGCGYHLDLLVLALVVVVSSVFGLPWFIANTIPSINHLQSLVKESSTSIPGEKPQFLGVREQRVTSLMIAILTGFSVLMTPILALIPIRSFMSTLSTLPVTRAYLIRAYRSRLAHTACPS